MCGWSTSALQCRPQLSGESVLDRRAAPFRGRRHRRPGVKKSTQEQRNNLRTHWEGRRRKKAEHGAMREAGAQPMFWPPCTKRSKLKMNFHFAFVMSDTTAQSAWLLWLAGTGVKRGGIAPQGNCIRTKRQTLSHSVAVGQGGFRKNGY